jgi:hypothetical protein
MPLTVGSRFLNSNKRRNISASDYRSGTFKHRDSRCTGRREQAVRLLVDAARLGCEERALGSIAARAHDVGGLSIRSGVSRNVVRTDAFAGRNCGSCGSCLYSLERGQERAGAHRKTRQGQNGSSFTMALWAPSTASARMPTSGMIADQCLGR